MSLFLAIGRTTFVKFGTTVGADDDNAAGEKSSTREGCHKSSSF